jgi:hypothetical protein
VDGARLSGASAVEELDVVSLATWYDGTHTAEPVEPTCTRHTTNIKSSSPSANVRAKFLGAAAAKDNIHNKDEPLDNEQIA